MMDALRRPEDVAVVVDAGAVFVARVPAGPLHILEGSASVIWVESLAGDRAGIADRVAERVGVEAADVREDVESFVAQLVGLGLLRPGGGPDSRA